MRDALNATGRPIVFSLCGWNPWYSNPDPALNYAGGKELANLWRIGPDDTNWPGVLANININSQLAANAGPDKGWNDPCLLLAEDLNGNLRVTQLQSRAQFSMWAIMASPLIISANIRNMSSMNIETYTNTEVIAVDQV
jgi:alpha-galactosidase|eukprot:COSAG02_NODE_843_length_16599_cov_6.528485_13_plen_139_part_00